MEQYSKNNCAEMLQTAFILFLLLSFKLYLDPIKTLLGTIGTYLWHTNVKIYEMLVYNFNVKHYNWILLNSPRSILSRMMKRNKLLSFITLILNWKINW